eukprot:TRINITY_DN47266_c0_g1_i1.p1 TRINITY_DN47266_c0_g1~~TRINITY_DN47266_c0_g1_i1.p1  ORF type:complete len:161 (-),score=6.49 TRINITY_DN47266_c0_g1_i1:444-926(-)
MWPVLSLLSTVPPALVTERDVQKRRASMTVRRTGGRPPIMSLATPCRRYFQPSKEYTPRSASGGMPFHYKVGLTVSVVMGVAFPMWVSYNVWLDGIAARRRHMNVYRDVEREKARRAALGMPPPTDEYVVEYEKRKAAGTLRYQDYAQANGFLSPPPHGK